MSDQTTTTSANPPTDADLAHYESIKVEWATLDKLERMEEERHTFALDVLRLRRVENENACTHPRRDQSGNCKYCGRPW